MWQRSKDAPAKLSGPAAERLARRYLEQQGLKTITTNYRTSYGEIDIIARDRDSLVFVEVRYRTRSDYGSAVESIDHRKQRRIISAARGYLLHHKLVDRTHCRFDVICISNDTTLPPNCPPYRVEWLRDAFIA